MEINSNESVAGDLSQGLASVHTDAFAQASSPSFTNLAAVAKEHATDSKLISVVKALNASVNQHAGDFAQIAKILHETDAQLGRDIDGSN
jgi:hypothetical protein